MRQIVCVASAILPFIFMTGAFAVGGGDIVFNLKNADSVQFSHDYHSKVKGLKCAACHFNRFAKGTGYEMKKETITKRDFCSHCHNGMKGFDSSADRNCTRCHKK